jgi:hypothetical protein
MSVYGDVDPGHVAASVVDRLVASSDEINAYWMKVTGDREAYAEKLRKLLSGQPIGVFVVRDISFNNPNSVAADVIKILEINQAMSASTVFAYPSELHCAVILLGRMPLSVSQVSSPVTLPEWSPIKPGETVSIIVEDLTWSVDAPLNCPEAKIGEMCEMLHVLEGILVSRLSVAHLANHNIGNAFMEIIRRDPSEKYGLLLKEFADQHAKVSTPTAFRPSLREGGSLTARIWGIVQACSPEQLGSPSKALATALSLELESWSESFSAVMTRPSNQDASAHRRFARSLLMTVAASCQFITAAAHADAYKRFPVPLIVSFSYELRRSLADYEGALSG